MKGLYRCDRCGKVESAARGFGDKMPAGWMRVSIRVIEDEEDHLCRPCGKVFIVAHAEIMKGGG